MKVFFPWDDSSPCVEPEKRWVGGRFGWAIHRFPIKGGKTFRETVWKDWQASIAKNITQNNALYRQLVGRHGKGAVE